MTHTQPEAPAITKKTKERNYQIQSSDGDIVKPFKGTWKDAVKLASQMAEANKLTFSIYELKGHTHVIHAQPQIAVERV